MFIDQFKFRVYYQNCSEDLQRYVKQLSFKLKLLPKCENNRPNVFQCDIQKLLST